MARYVTEEILETECIGDSLTKINTNFEDLDTVFKTLSTNVTALSAEGASVTTSSTAPSNPSDGDLWFDEDTGILYVYYNDGNSAQWVDVGAGGGGGGGTSVPVGGGTDKVFWENDQAVTQNYTITSGKNAMTAGPITINSGAAVTVPAGSVWTVV